MTPCGICGRLIPVGHGIADPSPHPPHTDAELAETKVAVEAAASALAFLFYLDKARAALAGGA